MISPRIIKHNINIIKFHPFEQNPAAFIFYTNRIITLPVTEQGTRQEWNAILSMAKNNGLEVEHIDAL